MINAEKFRPALKSRPGFFCDRPIESTVDRATNSVGNVRAMVTRRRPRAVAQEASKPPVRAEYPCAF
jgi:hypothetical protein